MRVYIMPCGWDKELVLKTAFKSGADKVCIVSAYPKKNRTYSKSDQITQKVNEKIVKSLSKFTEVETIMVNYLDLKEIILEVNKYIKKQKGHEVVVNISTGSRLLSASLFLVAQVNSCKVEYSVAKNHNPKIMEIIENGEDYHKGFSEIIELPSIP